MIGKTRLSRAKRTGRRRAGMGWARTVVLGLAAALLSAVGYRALAAAQTPPEQRKAAQAAQKAGNFKDAYEAFAKLLAMPEGDPMQTAGDLVAAVECLQLLGRIDEIDNLREKAVVTHATNRRLLEAASLSYAEVEHQGAIVAGKFYRGGRREGDGKQVHATERDRVRSLQLMREAARLADGEANKSEAGDVYVAFAERLLDSRFDDGAWRLQYLSDLTKLPDYEEDGRGSHDGYGGGYGNGRGAPVDEKGDPVFHRVPKSWDEAKTDGERWRWCLARAAEINPAQASQVQHTFAAFLREQFDVQTLLDGGYGFRFRRGGGVPGLPGREDDNDETRKDESGPYAVQTLGEDETIARLASGIKRFKLPDEFNFIRIGRALAAAAPEQPFSQHGAQLVAMSFEDRQQYDKAAAFWKLCVDRNWSREFAQGRLDQIVGNWGLFDPKQTVAAGAEAKLSFVFRNGNKATFEAHELDVRKLLGDVREYLKSKPKQLDSGQMQVDNIGYRLVQANQNQYLGKQAAKWEMALKPRAGHFDRRVAVRTPLKAGGAYLVRATMEGGNTTSIVLWIADTAIVKKAVDDGSYYFVADAATGAPVGKATLDFFGYRHRYLGNEGKDPQVDTKQFAELTDADGQLLLKPDQQAREFQWLATATTPDGRFAYHGFDGIWSGRHADRGPAHDRAKVLTITDRPVYRPMQTVKFKTWIGQTQYDQQGPSPFADKRYTLRVTDPRGERVHEQAYTTDAFGGLNGELSLGKDATLGVYTIDIIAGIDDVGAVGGNTFRVEEYKKPEFEVKVDAPTDPVMLGEKISATIKSAYYFGNPVTSARVKFKVLRSDYRAEWFPPGRWDWFYEPGYWWFGADYAWWPGWAEWGCRRPFPSWYPRQMAQPELVMESEVPVGPDGTVKVEIDTAIAKELHADTDHKYEITAEVTDESRRTITGTGTVSVARKPFKVYAWVNRGYYAVGDVVEAQLSAQTLDKKPVKGKGELKLFAVTYDAKLRPTEREVQKWDLATDDQGRASQKLKADAPGQYRLSYRVTDDKGRAIEGGYVFVVRGAGFDGTAFRFNDIELVADKKEYAAGETVRLMVNTNRANATVLLFARAANGVCLPPKVVRLQGKSTIEEIGVVQKDMPNFFVEAVTVGDGRVFGETREIVVPPENKVVHVEVLPSQSQYKPGERAKVQLKLTDAGGKPVAGSAVVSIYDKSVEYISGGSNVPEIRSFFWKWRRSHRPDTETNLSRGSGTLHKSGQPSLQWLGQLGSMVADLPREGEAVAEMDFDAFDAVNLPEDGYVTRGDLRGRGNVVGLAGGGGGGGGGGLFSAAKSASAMDAAEELGTKTRAQASAPRGVAPAVRTNFADTALWNAAVTADAAGLAEVELAMPENLTTWKAKVWTMASGTRVGEGSAEVTTYKNLIVRLQAPRFFVQKDEVVLSANVHNYLKGKQRVKVTLAIDERAGAWVTSLDAKIERVAGRNGWELDQHVEVDAGGEARVDWRVRIDRPGEVVVRMLAITDEESDATQLSFPAYVHGMLKTDSFAGAIRPDQTASGLTYNIPAERIPGQSRVEIRYSPSVASAMVDALPYLVDFPYGCTEQTLNRFLPTVITQRVLLDMEIDLKDVAAKRTNLNAGEIGDDKKRAEDWKRNNPRPGGGERNPVFDIETVKAMTREGVTRLTNMQNPDGGWGWFSGAGETSGPHTTAVVVHGLQVAAANDVTIADGVLENGVEWLKRYQATQVELLKRAAGKKEPYKKQADNEDAFVHMVLTDAGAADEAMKAMWGFLFRDRNHLSVYCKAQLALARMTELGRNEKADVADPDLDMLLKNLTQYVVTDAENQTAYLKLPEDNRWWHWYGSDTEANAYYLKVLSRADPKGEVAPMLAKYLITNRRNASYWNSTRDTALCIEALAEYVKASGEDKPDLTVAIAIDGNRVKEVKINAANFFSFDNKVVIEGEAVTAGPHKVEITKVGKGPLYYNAYVTNFTLEDPIKSAGLEIRVNRKFYRLRQVEQTIKATGSRGQALDQKVVKYEREEMKDLATLKSGELVEVELEIDSKNDYEYVIFEDMKASGFEPVEIRSGYNGNDLNAYMELRDERVCFFAAALARGKHSVAYRLRAESPGQFAALPTRASAMYAPELRANSDEFKVRIEDAPAAKPVAAAGR